MIQILALAGTLVASLSVRYPMRGQQAEPGEHSCGAAERLAHDRYDVIVNSDGAVVNGTPWRVEQRDAHSATLAHHNDGAYSAMRLRVWDDGAIGRVEITGLDENRAECSDAARLTRR